MESLVIRQGADEIAPFISNGFSPLSPFEAFSYQYGGEVISLAKMSLIVMMLIIT